MTTRRPHLIVIARPNGTGKSTTAPSLLKGTLHVTEFVNADLIDQGLYAKPYKKAQVKEPEKEIDQLVYKLYGLAGEEIKIVGDSSRHK